MDDNMSPRSRRASTRLVARVPARRLTSVGWAAACLCSAGTAWGQAAPAPALAASTPEAARQVVTVTGQRASNIASVAAKRNEFRIMDAISADEARALPDSTLAETVQRVPGVSVTYNADNRNGRDEAQRPVIRGMDARYNNSTVDGAPLASTDSNNWTTGGNGVRGARLDLLPSSMLQRVEVFKSWTPERDPNTIGGSVNVVTRSAFSGGGKDFFSASAALGVTNDHGQPRPDDRLARRGELTASRVFGERGNLGLVIAVDYRRQDTNTLGQKTNDSGYYNYYSATGAPLGGNLLATGSNGIPVPAQNKFFLFQNSRERRGATGKLEFRPFDGLDLALLAGRYESRNQQDRHEQIFDLARNSQTATPQCPRNLPVLNQTPTSGEVACGEVEMGLQQSDIRRSTQIFGLNAEWVPRDNHRVTAGHSVSTARYDETVYMAKYAAATLNYPSNPQSSINLSAHPQLGLRYDTSALNFSTEMRNPSFAANPANYQAFYWRDVDGHARNRVENTRIEWEHNMDAAARGLGWALGVHRNVSRYRYDWNHVEWQPRQAGATLATAGYASGYVLPNTGGLPLLVVDVDASRRQLTDGVGNPFLRTNANLDQTLQDDFMVEETLEAAFASLAWGGSQWRAQFGLRHDQASIEAEANERRTRSSVVTWTPTQSRADYRYLLPSLTLSWKPAPDWTVRAAASKTIGRPDYAHYAPRVTVSQASNGDLSVNLGNPDIRPRESVNLDLSAEWYFGNGLIALAAFDKDISNEIFNLRRTDQLADDAGVLQRATITQPMNSAKARLHGAEIGGVLNSLAVLHPALRPFGLSANLTVLDGRMQVPNLSGAKRDLNRLTGQPDRIANLTMFYNDGGLELRAAYNRVGMSLRSIQAGSPWQDVFWAARGQLDLSARYKLSGTGFTVFAQMANAGTTRVISLTGPDRDLLKDTYTVPRTFWLGLSYRL